MQVNLEIQGNYHKVHEIESLTWPNSMLSIIPNKQKSI